MPRQRLARGFCALFFIGVALHAYAAGYSGADKSGMEIGNESANDGVVFGFDIGFDREHQEFSDSSADLTTASLVPRVDYKNWELSLDLPWQRAEGGYFVNNGFSPSPIYACQQQALNIAKYPGRLAYLQSHPNTAVGQLYAYCQSQANAAGLDDSVSGLSDATVFLRYALPLDADGIWLLGLGGGYKFDNGDYEKNLGSGTRNTLLEASLGASYGWFIGSVTAGYAWINATDATGTESNYTYGLVDLGIRPLNWLTLGCNWSSDESYYSGLDTVQKTTAYVRVKPLDHIGVKVYVSDYGSTDGYPDREYGASIFYTY